MIIPSPVSRRPRIEIIPLIDIIFFLLATFVMVSLSMVKNQGISVNLPVAATSEVKKEKAITITIDKNQEIYIDQKQVSLEGMSSQLSVLKASDPDLKVLINGDADLPFGKAIAVLDEIRRLGIAKVAIRTKISKNRD